MLANSGAIFPGVALAVGIALGAPWLRAQEENLPVEPETPRNVLVFYSNQRMLPANIEIHRGLWSVLREEIDAREIQLFEDYLETNRLPFGKEETAMAALLAERYRNAPPDVVVVVGPPALGFLDRWQDLLFPDAALVFAAVRRDDLEVLESKRRAAGVLHDTGAGPVVRAISRLLPDMAKALLIAGSADFDRRLLRRIRSVVAETTAWEIEEIADLSVPEVSDRLASAEEGTVALYATYFSDPSGSIHIPRKVLERISAASAVPVFAFYDSMVGAGAVGIGGSPMADQGKAAGRIVERLISGESVEAIGVLPAPAFRLYFDARAMKRHGLDPGRLPGEAELLFRERGLIEAHPFAFTAALVAIVLQTALILSLLLARRRRNRAERKANRMERYFSTVFRESPNPIAILRARDGTIVDVNPAWESLYAVERGDALGRSPLEIGILPEENDAPRYADFLAATESLAGYERKIRTGTGEWKDVAFYSNAVEIEGEPLRIVITVDNGPRLETERLRANLARDNRVAQLGHLSAWIAHEINQPLGSILNNAEVGLLTLRRNGEGPDSPLREILREIRDDIRRASKVVERVRSMLGNRPAAKEPLDPRQIVEEVFRMSSREATRRSVDLRLDPGPPDEGPVSGDRVLLLQVMLNLVLNAMEAVASVPLSRRTVTLGWETSRDGRGTAFFVRDNGPGVPGDENELFEPFLTTKKDGMGLGLAVSRFIAEDHGGSLDCERPEGGGSCFRLKLPRETPAP